MTVVEFNEIHEMQPFSKCCSHSMHMGRTYGCPATFCIHPDRDVPTMVLPDQVCNCYEKRR